jgi:transposase
MPKRDLVTVARRGELTVAEVAADFDISPESVKRWLRQADIDDGVRDGLTTAEQAEVVQFRRGKRRLKMENEILCRAAAYYARDSFPKMTFPLVRRLSRRGNPGAVDLRVLGFSPQAFYKWNAPPRAPPVLTAP